MQVPAGLVRSGHFAFSSGHHGDTWLDLDALIADAARFHESADLLAKQLAVYGADVVCGPLEGGAFVAQCVAASLGLQFSYTTPSQGYALNPAADVARRRVLVVDDAVNAGSAVLGTVAVLRERMATVVAVGALLVCNPAGADIGDRIGVPQHQLLAVESALWPADACPLCAGGVAVEVS